MPAVSRGSGLHIAVILLWGGRFLKNQKPHLGAERWAGSLEGEKEVSTGLLGEEVLGKGFWGRGFWGRPEGALEMTPAAPPPQD